MNQLFNTSAKGTRTLLLLFLCLFWSMLVSCSPPTPDFHTEAWYGEWLQHWRSTWKNKPAKEGYPKEREISSLCNGIYCTKSEDPEPTPPNPLPDNCPHAGCDREHSNKKDHNRYHKNDKCFRK